MVCLCLVMFKVKPLVLKYTALCLALMIAPLASNDQTSGLFGEVLVGLRGFGFDAFHEHIQSIGLAES